MVFVWQIYKEEVFDLLDPNYVIQTKGKAEFGVKPASLKIRERIGGAMRVDGVIQKAVNTKEEMGLYLSYGCLARATGITNMNSQSRYFLSTFPRNSHVLCILIDFA